MLTRIFTKNRLWRVCSPDFADLFVFYFGVIVNYLHGNALIEFNLYVILFSWFIACILLLFDDQWKGTLFKALTNNF